MRTVLGALVCVGMLASASARANDADACAVPAYLIASDSALPKVSSVVKDHKPLTIVVVGSRSSSLTGPDGSATSYPARLEAALREKLPGIEIHVVLDLRAKQSAAEVAAELDKIVEDSKPALVVWQTGTVDAMRSIDPDDFRTGLDDGVATLQRLNTDVILMNLQYSPRMETMIAVAPYNDTMRVVAQQRNVPMFDRFAIMRQWSDAGDFDLFGPAHGFGMAKRVHDCIGRALSNLVIDAAHINPATIGTQR